MIQYYRIKPHESISVFCRKKKSSIKFWYHGLSKIAYDVMYFLFNSDNSNFPCWNLAFKRLTFFQAWVYLFNESVYKKPSNRYPSNGRIKMHRHAPSLYTGKHVTSRDLVVISAFWKRDHSHLSLSVKLFPFWCRLEEIFCFGYGHTFNSKPRSQPMQSFRHRVSFTINLRTQIIVVALVRN